MNKNFLFLQDLAGQYVVELTFTMDEGLVGKTYALEVENNLGKTSYQFDLALADKPKTGNYQY